MCRGKNTSDKQVIERLTSLRDDPLGVVRSCLQVVLQAEDVRIDLDKLPVLGRELRRGRWLDVSWDLEVHLMIPDLDKLLEYVFVLDAMNFCFWSPRGWRKWRFDRYDGYKALAYKLRLLYENQIDLRKITYSQFVERILGNTEGYLLLLEKRYLNLLEVLRLLDWYGGALNLLEAVNYNLYSLFELVLRNCPSFRDTAIYGGRQVKFYKRLQILGSDLELVMRAFSKMYGKELPKLEGIEKLTAFADYKLPQLFRAYGILTYSEKLQRIIEDMELIPSGSPLEVEIRASTVVVVELLSEQLGMIPRDVDNALWELASSRKLSEPYHRTLTYFY